MNKVILIGNVGKEPEVKESIAKLTLATNKKYKDKNGEKIEQVEWHNIVFFGKIVDVVKNYVNKGSKIMVEGEIQYRTYEKDNTTKYFTNIVANGLELLDSKKTKPEPKQEAKEEVSDNDLPF